MPWYRVWTDILDSEKFAELDDSTIGGWTLILSAVKRFNRDGLLPPQKRLAHWTRRGKATVSAWINDLLEAGLLEEIDGGIRVHDWSHWQEPKDRTNAERQAKHRAKKRNVPSGLPQSRPETETDTEGEQSDNRYVTSLPLLHNGAVTVLRTPTHSPAHPFCDESVTGREGEEHQLFLAAYQALEVHEPTRYLAGQLLMAADTPGIRSLESWRLWVAAHVVQRPDKPKLWTTFEASAHRATWDEYQRLKPKGKLVVSTAPTKTDEEMRADVAANNAKLDEYRARIAREREAKNGRA